MALVAVRDLAKSYASHDLFERLTLTFQHEERVGLIGPNGAGKTTLLRILAGIETPDTGLVERARDARIVYLEQAEGFPMGETVEGALLAAAHAVAVEEYEGPVAARKMARRLGFDDAAATVASLSGGWRKRLAIGCALVQKPTLLLMDEPTNHLDLAGIAWLERFLERTNVALIMSSHDRYMLERIPNRIIEINPRYPGGFFSVRGAYSDFLEKREDLLHELDHERRALANEVRREVEWLRRGPAARSSKAGYRIDAAHRKIEQLSEANRRLNSGTELGVRFAASGRKTHDLITANGIAKSMGDRLLFEELDVHVQRGTRIGIAGNNASGKTTLLRILHGELAPDKGTVKHALDLKIALFDQQRQRLDPEQPLRRALSPSGDTVSYFGRSGHVIAWAKQFGFRPDQLTTPVGTLSGGEQARIMMAFMMRETADVLMLDEPTNDLDIASIEVLESALLEFPGAVVLISHDRHLLDRVCTDLIGLHDDAQWGRYGQISQWLDHGKEPVEPAATSAGSMASRAGQPVPSRAKRSGLTYHEKREWETIEARVLCAEEEVELHRATLNDPEIAADHEKLQAAYEAHEAAQQKLDELLARWATLEEKNTET